MSNLVQFNQIQPPAYVAQLAIPPDRVKAMNAAAALGTGGGGGVNKISLKQSRFRLVVNGVETVLPVLAIQVALLRVNDGINKTWFEKAWNPDAEPTQPECSSDDGILPRLDSPKRQANDCASCPWNQWGSSINPTNGKKTKACQDSKRMAVIPPGPNGRFTSKEVESFQLAIPPASLTDFGSFVRSLGNMPTPAAYNMVVVEVSFDTEATFPKLNFRPIRWFENDEFEVVASRYTDAEVMRTAGLAEAQTYNLGAPSLAPQLAAPAAQVHHLAHQAPAPASYVDPNAAAFVQQPVYVQPAQQVQQVQQVQQPAPVQEAPAGWGAAAPVPVQEAPAGWGSAEPVQQPAAAVVQQPVVQQPAAAVVQQPVVDNGGFDGWGNPVTGQIAQPAPQPQQAQPAQQAQQPAQGDEQWTRTQPVSQPQVSPQVHQPVHTDQPQVQGGAVRERGKASPGKARRTPAEMEEDRLADAAGGQQQAAQQTQQTAQDGPAGWGVATPTAAPKAATPDFDPLNPFAGAPQQQTTGAPNQPGVLDGSAADVAFAGWDDPVAQ